MPQAVLHPIGIVAAQWRNGVVCGTLIVTYSVCAAAFFARCGRDHGGLCALDQVFNFQGFNASSVEDFGGVGQSDGIHAFANFSNFHHTFVHGGLCPEYGGVNLHGSAHVVGHIL